MVKSEVKVACIGVGPRGTYLASMSSEVANLVAVCDLSEENLVACKKNFEGEGITGVQYFTSMEEMFATVEINSVIVATPLPTHCDVSIACLNAGKNVYCEIPTFNSKEEAVRLSRAVAAHPELKFTAAENCCYWGFVHSWKKMHDDGMLGNVVFAEAEYLHHNGNPPKQVTWRSDMAALRYITHSLGPLLYFTGDECEEIHGYNPGYNPYEGLRKAPNGLAVIRTKRGSIFKVFMGFGTFFPCTHNYTVYGTKGSLQVQCNLEDDSTDDKQTLAHLKQLDDVPYMHGHAGVKIPFDLIMPDRPLKTIGHGGHGDISAFKAFLQSVEQDTPAPMDFKFGYQMTLPGILAEESAAQNGIAIKMPTVEELAAELGM